MVSLTIRPALAHERARLEDLQRRASLANAGDREALLAHPDAIELPPGQIARGDVLVAQSGDEVVGFAAVLDREDGDVELDGLFVDPMHWRRGIARRLVDRCGDIARERGAKALHVVGNPHADGFYRACGFVEVGTQPTRFGTGLLMCKHLGTVSRPLHIGIVGCSAEGASLCYRTICEEGSRLLGAHAHPEISMHTHSLAQYVKCLDAGDTAEVGELMLSSANKLARAGADFLICPDNTIHQAFELVQLRSPLPWLHIAEVVAQEARARGFRKLGLTGTRWLVDSDVYPAKLRAADLEYVKPPADQREPMNRFIMEDLVYGRFTDEAVRCFQSAIEGLKAQGCDAVVLGCTEIPLIIDDTNSPLPTLDSTRLLARAALRRAVG